MQVRWQGVKGLGRAVELSNKGHVNTLLPKQSWTLNLSTYLTFLFPNTQINLLTLNTPMHTAAPTPQCKLPNALTN